MSPDTHSVAPLKIAVLIPLRDDWDSAAVLLRLLDRALAADPCAIDVLFVNDGSLQQCPVADFKAQFAVIRSIRVLNLRCSLGHQRAIATGLVYCEKTIACDAVLVMDGDGEDTAEGALQLIRSFSGSTGLFAERIARKESLFFRFCYALYKPMHSVLTGVDLRVGNFSLLPFSYLRTLTVMPELWNHYAAASIRSGLPLSTRPIARGKRIAGKSKMNFVALVLHGLSAISVFADRVGARLLVALSAISAVAILGILVAAVLYIAGDWKVSVWAVASFAVIAVVLAQLTTLAGSFTFTQLSNRSRASFVPRRDCEIFVESCHELSGE